MIFHAGTGLAVVSVGLANDGPALTAPVLSATNLTPTSVQLTWTPGTGATTYQPKYKPDGGSYSDFGSPLSAYTVVITGLTANSLYNFKVTATNGQDTIDSNIVPKTTEGLSPILTLQKAKMVSLINAMTIAGGYNYDWGTSQEPDTVQKSAFPNAEVYFKPEDVFEENVDEPDGAHSGAYDNHATAEIHVFSKLSTIKDVPNISIDTEYAKALDDLKRLFGRNPQLDSLCNSILYQNARKQETKSGDLFVPGKLISTWRVWYTQDRENPSQLSN